MKLGVVAACAGLVGTAVAGLSNGELQNLAHGLKSGVISLNDGNYKAILSGPRDYHLVVLMSLGSPQLNCVLCNEFKPEYDIVGSSWLKEHPTGVDETEVDQEIDEDTPKKPAPKNVYFLYSEYMESKNLFTEFQLNSIPKVFYFPPVAKGALGDYLTQKKEYLFFTGDHKDLLINWLSEFTGHRFKVVIPPNYTRIAINIGGAISSIAIIAKNWDTFYKIASLRGLWLLVSLVTILLFILGYMFNQIRGTPYVREMGDRVEYFQQGQQSQYGVETQIILFIYGALLLSAVVLIKKLPGVSNSQVQFLTVVLFLVLLFMLYLVLLLIFRIKSPSYPYNLVRFL